MNQFEWLNFLLLLSDERLIEPPDERSVTEEIEMPTGRGAGGVTDYRRPDR